MITGVVKGDKARIRLKIRGSRGREQEIEAVIDTGFTAWLTLPPSEIAALGLPWQRVDPGIMADGSESLFDIYSATVRWDGRSRRIPVDEADTEPLVGMALLKGYELKMQVRPRGKVTIKRLSRP
jgi:clan AA aspartic protease